MKRLYRSRTDRWIAGVCGGIGEFFAVDSNPVRLAFALLTLWNGFGILLYLLMVIIVPEDPLEVPVADTGLPPPLTPEENEVERQRRFRLLGVIAVLGGIYLLLRNSEVLTMLLQDRTVAGLLIVGGLLILLLRPTRL